MSPTKQVDANKFFFIQDITLRLNHNPNAISIVNNHGKRKLSKLVGSSFVGFTFLEFREMRVNNIVANGRANDWFTRTH